MNGSARAKMKALSQYRIAEKYLNIISGPTFTPQDPEELVEIILRNPKSLAKLSKALNPILGAKLTPLEE